MRLDGSKKRSVARRQVAVSPQPYWTLAAPSRSSAAKGRFAPQALDAPVPTVGRLQRYDASLRLRVDDVDGLSRATQRAITLTRGLGGYVGSIQYATGGKRGGATLVLRVPVGHVQAALDGLSSLGTILQQHTGILDVTRRADREAEQIAKLERELATASPYEAPVIRAHLKTLRAKHARLLRSARLAKITVALTTPRKHAAAARSRLDRTLDDAGSVLVRELEILLYALVVAGPLLLLGAAGIATREQPAAGQTAASSTAPESASTRLLQAVRTRACAGTSGAEPVRAEQVTDCYLTILKRGYVTTSFTGSDHDMAVFVPSSR